jgi:oligosaccharide translocation protein RFT1
MVEGKNSRPAAQPQVSAARGTSYLILIQVVSRVLTFASNQLVLRRLSPEVFGVATQLELYYITVLFFSRECLRAAIQREPLAGSSADVSEKINSPSKNDKQGSEQEREHAQDVSRSSQTVVNMSYLAIALGVLLSGFLGICYHSLATTETASVPFFYQSVQLVGFSCIIELGTEPFFAVVLQRMLYKERAAVEMTAAFARSLVTCGFTIWASWKGWYTGVLPFGLGYLAFACALLSGYSWQMLTRDKTRAFSFWLTPIQSRYEDIFPS